jgi:hypothetical protein
MVALQGEEARKPASEQQEVARHAACLDDASTNTGRGACHVRYTVAFLGCRADEASRSRQEVACKNTTLSFCERDPEPTSRTEPEN